MFSKRQSNSSSALPSPFTLSPSQAFRGNDGQWATFALQVGLPSQNIEVLVSGISPETWVISGVDGCPVGIPLPADEGNERCFDSRGRLFNSNQSTSWIPNSIYTLGVEANLGLDTTADYGFDSITLGWQGSNLPQSLHQVIAEVDDPHYWLGSVGLNPQSTNFTNYDDPQPSLLTTLKQTKNIPSLSWAYTAGAIYRYNQVFGSLVFGGYDASLFSPSNAISVQNSADQSRDLVVAIRSISTNTTGNPALLPGGPVYAFVDSTIAPFWLPLDACNAFESAFGLTYNEAFGLYLVNDTLHTSLLASNPSVTFTLGASSSGGPTTQITLPYAAFDLEISYPYINYDSAPFVNSSRYFPLMRAANNTQYTLGRAFLQEAYLIADYERLNFTLAPRIWRPDWATDASLKTIYPLGYSPPSVSSTLGAGAIAGIVVGVVAALLLIAGAAFFFLRRSRKHRRAAAAAAAAAAEPKPLSSSDASSPSPVSHSTASGTHPSHLYAELGAQGGAYAKTTEDRDADYGAQGAENTVDRKEMEAVSSPQEMADPHRTMAWEADGNNVYELPGEIPIGKKVTDIKDSP